MELTMVPQHAVQAQALEQRRNGLAEAGTDRPLLLFTNSHLWPEAGPGQPGGAPRRRPGGRSKQAAKTGMLGALTSMAGAAVGSIAGGRTGAGHGRSQGIALLRTFPEEYASLGSAAALEAVRQQWAMPAGSRGMARDGPGEMAASLRRAARLCAGSGLAAWSGAPLADAVAAGVAHRSAPERTSGDSQRKTEPAPPSQDAPPPGDAGIDPRAVLAALSHSEAVRRDGEASPSQGSGTLNQAEIDAATGEAGQVE